MPRATAVEENTPIIVSVEAVFASLTTRMAIVINTEKKSIDQIGFSIPNITPMAIPVRAE
jgi:hypothetical protein